MQTNLKLIISDAVEFFLNHWRQIAVLCLPWLLAAGCIEILLAAIYQPSGVTGQLYLLAVAFKLLVYPVYTAALILLMAERAQQKSPGSRDLMNEAIRLWQPFFMMVLMMIALFASGSLVMLILEGLFQSILSIKGLGIMMTGLMLLWGMARLSFAKYILVLDRVKPWAAIVASFHGTRPYFFKIVILLAMYVLPLLGLNILTGVLLNKVSAPQFFRILIGSGIEYLMLFVDVVIFRLYMSVIHDNPTKTPSVSN